MAEVIIKSAIDTACLVAFYRAQESERQGAFFRDSLARRLAGERGEEIASSYPAAERERWGIVLRTLVYDDMIKYLLAEEQIDMVINLGAGFDTRPYRLELPNKLRWVETDLPQLIERKEQLLVGEKARCQVERVKMDITDHPGLEHFLVDKARHTRNVLVLCEGVLLYLAQEQVEALSRTLYQSAIIRWWMTEIVMPESLASEEQGWNVYAAEEVRSRFAPREGMGFFEQQGWNVAIFRSALREGVRYSLPLRVPWYIRLLLKVSKDRPDSSIPHASGFLLLGKN